MKSEICIKRICETKQGLKLVIVPKRSDFKTGDYVILQKVKTNEQPKIKILNSETLDNANTND